MVYAAGSVTILAGGTAGSGTYVYNDGLGTNAQLGFALGMVTVNDGIYIADSQNHVVRYMSYAGTSLQIVIYLFLFILFRNYNHRRW
jgi:hypothetical protein